MWDHYVVHFVLTYRALNQEKQSFLHGTQQPNVAEGEMAHTYFVNNRGVATC